MNEMLTQERLDAITARCEAATPGPWKVVEGKSFGVQSENKNIANCFRAENEQFIAHARQDIPALLAEVERLREERDRAIAALEDLIGKTDSDVSCPLCKHNGVRCGYDGPDYCAPVWIGRKE
jgi:hypothetical protein